MDKKSLEKFNSFEKNSPKSSHHIARDSGSGSGSSSRSESRSGSSSFGRDTLDEHQRHQNRENIESFDRVRATDEINEFLNVLSAIEDKTVSLPEVPDAIKNFTRFIESRVLEYNAAEMHEKFGKVDEEDKFFIESVGRLYRLTTLLSEFSSDAETNVTTALNQTSVALQRAMVFLEEEFRVLLDDSRNRDPERENSKPVHKMSSFNSKSHHGEHSDRSIQPAEENSSVTEENYPGYSPEAVERMHDVATTMISAGYETECCQVYYISRRNAIRNRMAKLEFEIVLNMDDVVRLPWESLEIEISRWISVVKTCSEVIFPAEKSLGEAIFSGFHAVHRNSFSGIVRMVVIQLLDFAEATAMAKRSAEKLFKYLDMYEALQQLIPAIDGGETSFEELMAEVAAAVDRIGELASTIFCDLENSIQSDVARAPVPGGAVHPLTRYVMNYLKYACEYKDTLEKIFADQSRLENKYAAVSKSISAQDLERESESPHNFQTVANATPFSIQVVAVMDLLDANLNTKSKLYKDASLRYIFLMNNGRYILQKVKGSSEIRQVMGDTWCRRRSTIVRQYHTNYQRETWSRVLQTLSHEGLLTNGKVNKPLLKERLKVFTTVFEEIHRTQSAWIVSDEQLQSELRISISGVVIPAYRSFVGRFRQHLDSGRQADKYIKYQPEDIETLIEGLFDGNTNSMGRRKT